MDRLPSELLQIIFEYSSNEDIINLPYSISCKGLTDGELSRRFTVYRGIWIDERSLKLLVRASNHPLIGLTIQELQFDLDRIPFVCRCEFRDRHWSDRLAGIKACEAQRLCRWTWHTATDCRAYCSPKAAHTSLNPSLNTSFEYRRCKYCKHLDRNWARYQHFYQSQCRFEQKERDIDMMTSAFESLASVTTITIANQHEDWNRNVRELLGDAWRLVFDHAPVKDSGIHLMKVISKALTASRLKLQHSRQLSGNIGCTSMSGRGRTLDDIADLDLSQMLSRMVCQDVFPRLRILLLEDIYYSPDESHQYALWRARDEDVFAQDFQRCTYCDKNNVFEQRNMEDDGDSQRGCSDLTLTQPGTTRALAAILRSCPLIEELHLRFFGCGWKEDAPHIPLLKMLGHQNQLSSLRRLELENCRIEEDQLSGALLRCAPTLEMLYLSDIVLDRGTWMSLLDGLRGRFVRLKTFEQGPDVSFSAPLIFCSKSSNFQFNALRGKVKAS